MSLRAEKEQENVLCFLWHGSLYSRDEASSMEEGLSRRNEVLHSTPSIARERKQTLLDTKISWRIKHAVSFPSNKLIPELRICKVESLDRLPKSVTKDLVSQALADRSS